MRTATSYFDPVWNAFSKHTDGSMQWIPKQIVAIGEYFHTQVGVTRITIKLDRLIVLSKSSLLGWFLHVSLILIIKGRYPREVLLIVIIKQVSA